MDGMKTKSVHEVLVPSVGLLLVLGLWSAAPNALVSAHDIIAFMLSDGDVVTCYPIQNQTSLSNGTPFNRYPTTMITPGSNTYNTRGARRAWQTMAEEVGACPDGTIPIRAPRGENVPIWPRVGGVAKKSPWRPVRSSQKSAASDVTLMPPHEYGVASIYEQANQSYKGTEVFVNIWDPYVESSREFSLAQLWLAAGKNTIEAGYQVSTGNFGDCLPRLFVYWTADSYKSTGCYNLRCPGFVQVSNLVLLGGSFSTSTISHQKRRQYEIKLRVFKDDGTGDWWLQLNDEYVGYWPKEIYNVTTPFNYADNLSWGGEIVDDEGHDGNNHTTTEMGSGKFASEGYTRAAYQRNVQYIDMNNTLVDAPIFVYDTENSCYSAMMGTDYADWKSFFFYGGKGWSSKCGRDPAYPPSPQTSPSAGGDALAPPPTSGN